MRYKKKKKKKKKRAPCLRYVDAGLDRRDGRREKEGERGRGEGNKEGSLPILLPRPAT